MAGCSSSPSPTGPPAAASPEDLVQQLATAYRTQDLQLLPGLLAADPELPDYVFLAPPEGGFPGQQWNRDEELRIHTRMFDPVSTQQGTSPLPEDLWISTILITLTQETPFVEVPELYASTSNPTGISPQRWKALEAIYGTDVLFDLEGEIDYQVNGQCRFVVVEDLQISPGEAGRLTMLRWEELPMSKAGALKPSAVRARSWGELKTLYR
jgi:hypothetical protein